MKRKLLFISMCLPYEKVPHAGGKTFHYYLNSFASEEENEVTLISKVMPDEKEYVDTINKSIRVLTVSTPESGIRKYWSYIKSLNSKFNPWYKFGNTLTKEIYDQIRECLKKLKSEAYSPDIIILEWTEMLLFVEEVKKFFPKAKYVASEHDVSYLRLEREVDAASNRFMKLYKKGAYKNIVNREITAIKSCDLVVVQNQKDYDLLLKTGMADKKFDVITPFYDSYLEVERAANRRDILFYGAMNRTENSSAALWFIENVLRRLEDLNIRFIIVGNKPPKELRDLQNERIIVTGFVEDVSEYFANSMCLVAPLQLGAGVKVKIIEALSAGNPVLTNQIGIEGIAAQDGIHYLHCETPEEYEHSIRKLASGEICPENISDNARALIKAQYHMEASFQHYKNRMYKRD